MADSVRRLQPLSFALGRSVGCCLMLEHRHVSLCRAALVSISAQAAGGGGSPVELPVVGHLGSRLTRHGVMVHMGGVLGHVRSVEGGKSERSKVLTITPSEGFLPSSPPPPPRLSSILLLVLSFAHFPPLSLSRSHYLAVTLFDLEIPAVCGETETTEREGGQMRGGQQQVVVMETGRIVTRLTSTGAC